MNQKFIRHQLQFSIESKRRKHDAGHLESNRCKCIDSLLSAWLLLLRRNYVMGLQLPTRSKPENNRSVYCKRSKLTIKETFKKTLQIFLFPKLTTQQSAQSLTFISQSLVIHLTMIALLQFTKKQLSASGLVCHSTCPESSNQDQHFDVALEELKEHKKEKEKEFQVLFFNKYNK